MSKRSASSRLRGFFGVAAPDENEKDMLAVTRQQQPDETEKPLVMPYRQTLSPGPVTSTKPKLVSTIILEPASSQKRRTSTGFDQSSEKETASKKKRLGAGCCDDCSGKAR